MSTAYQRQGRFSQEQAPLCPPAQSEIKVEKLERNSIDGGAQHIDHLSAGISPNGKLDQAYVPIPGAEWLSFLVHGESGSGKTSFCDSLLETTTQKGRTTAIHERRSNIFTSLVRIKF